MPSLAKGKHSSQWLEQLSTPRGGRRRRPLLGWLHPGAGFGCWCGFQVRCDEEREGFFAFSDCLNVFLDFLSAKRVTLIPASALSTVDAA